MSNQTPDQRPEDQQSLGGDNLSELPPFEGRPIKPASFPAHRRTIASIGNPGPNSAARSARRGAGVVEARSAESRFSVSCGQSQRTGITGTSPGSLYRHLPIYQHLWETAAARWPQPKKQAYGVCLRPPSARGRRGEVTKVVLFPPLTTTGLTC